ncbi:hypothetical protein GE061_017987 [Apolygus lucorum]|uniref:C3H1-type domain-containing protein n=1 Tax=Apolygus lucorum TaxID=248454 RepID=A0A8S9XEL7_APOLU|nr:hypothetical protein GE061_017987 [Apolygus lucorum]
MASLVADYGESSAGSSDDSESENIEKHEEPTTNIRLPPPTFTDKIKNSVFVNPFLEAENAKLTVLEKHVKMVPQTNGKEHKKICWMFKKGNCRFGKKCKFLHDDPSTTVGTTPAVGTTESKDTNYVQIQEALGDDPDERGSDDDEPLKKKKRPGLTRGLIPGKKFEELRILNLAMASGSGENSASIAQLTWEMSNEVETVNGVDEIYRYDKKQQQDILNAKPWEKE